MNKKTKWMNISCGLILAAGMTVFAFLMMAVRTRIHSDALMSAHAAGIYLYCIGAVVPCVAAVGMLMMVIREIGKDCAFSLQNERWMKGISVMAALECVYILVGMVGWAFAGVMYLRRVILALAVIMFGAAVSILAWSLAKLIRRASDIQQENDLTI